MILSQLQNLIKRDPQSYHDEFSLQFTRWKSLKQIFLLKPTEETKDFVDLANFLSHVSGCYKKEAEKFPDEIYDLLDKHSNVMTPNVRRTLVQSLILLRNKEMIPSARVLELFFRLFRCKDKQLREMVFNHIVQDIKQSNSKHKNNKLNANLQNFMFTMLQDSNEVAAKKSLDVMIDLYNKGIWNDTKTVNIISRGCLSDDSKILTSALQFFLTTQKVVGEDSDDENDPKEIYEDLKRANRHAKKTSKRDRKLKTILKQVKKKEVKKGNSSVVNFSAINLLNDPQGLAEKMFSKLKKTNHKFELRVLIMDFISRLIGIHQLILFDFYSFLQKYYQPHQQEVAKLLAITCQACHSLVPPDVIQPCVAAIANNFVADHCSNEAMTVGLNSIREITSRCPLAMEEGVLERLTLFKNHRDKGVNIAAKSLIALFRDVDPTMLRKKDRGKTAQMNLKNYVKPVYGQTQVPDSIEGIELLEDLESKKRRRIEDHYDEENDDEEDFIFDDEDQEEGEEGEESGEEGEEEEEVDDEEYQNDDDEEEEEEEGEEIEEEEEEDQNEQDEQDEDDKENEENEENGMKQMKQTPPAKEDQKKNDKLFRILTQEDFAKLRKIKLLKQAQEKLGESLDSENILSKFEEEEDNEEEEEEEDELADAIEPESLFAHTKRKKQNYEERMASIESGREGRDKFGRKEKERGSKTNTEKRKTKKLSHG